MSKKPTFRLLTRQRTLAEAVEYDPLEVEIDGTVEHLALHRESKACDWLVSDPASGALVLRVNHFYKGCAVSSARLTAPLARVAAREQVQGLARNIGADNLKRELQRGRSIAASAKAHETGTTPSTATHEG